MGGLFSSDPRSEQTAQAQPTNRPTPTPNEARVYSTMPSYRQPIQPQLVARESSTTYASHYIREVYRPPTIPSNPRLIQGLSRVPLAPVVYKDPASSEWDRSSLPQGESFRLLNLSEYDEDFSRVQDAFNDGVRRKNFKITKVERVENPFLLGCYLLKKQEMIQQYGYVEEEVHFHGTKKSNVQQICENNFNWRLHGDHTGSRYGKGVSFSPISFYASHYSDKKDVDKIMFYVTVLVSNCVIGNAHMELPPKLNYSSNSRFDTTNKEDDSVAVKFSDNEFYPEFIIHYTTPAELPKPKKKNQPSQMIPTHPQHAASYAYDDYYHNDNYC